MSPCIDVHVRRTVAIARVDTKPTHEIRVNLLDGVYGVRHDATVRASDSTITIGIDHDIRGVTVLMATVPRRALHLRIVRRRPESRMYVERDHRVRRDAPHFRDFSYHKLQLVEKARIQGHVLWPDFLLSVVRYEVPQVKVLAHAELLVARTDLEKTLRLVVLAAEPLGQVSADLVAVQHSSGLLRERYQNRQRRLADSLLDNDRRVLRRAM